MAYPHRARFTDDHPKIFLNFDQVFKDIKVLGSGNFGETHLIEDIVDHTKYALKMLFLKDKNDFYREVISLINLSKIPNCDPDIVCYYNHFILPKNVYGTEFYCILMEYIPGVNLATFDESEQLSIKDIVRTGLWLLKTVGHLHKKGFAHNDITPGNIMVTKNMDLKLIDFGLTCFTIPNKNKYVKCKKDRLVNTTYASPEQKNGIYFTDVDRYSKTSDIYAIGLILYHLLTDSYPYELDKDGQIVSEYQDVRNKCMNIALQNMLLINPDIRTDAEEAHLLLSKCLK